MTFAIEIFKSFANFARVSKIFRCCLLDLDDLFPALEHLLTDDFAKLAEEDYVRKAMHYLDRLLVTFILYEDSKQRALNKGLIEVHAGMYSRLSKMERDGALDDPKEDPAEFARNKALVKKLEEADRQCRDAHDALKAIVVQTSYLEAIIESMAEWAERRAGAPLTKGSKAGPEYAKSLADWASWRNIETPIVCSWELCESGSAVDEGRTFSKCSNCLLAFYCR